jgi:hypothetical protein
MLLTPIVVAAAVVVVVVWSDLWVHCQPHGHPDAASYNNTAH